MKADLLSCLAVIVTTSPRMFARFYSWCQSRYRMHAPLSDSTTDTILRHRAVYSPWVVRAETRLWVWLLLVGPSQGISKTNGPQR